MNEVLSKTTSHDLGGYLRYYLKKSSHHNEDFGEYNSYGIRIVLENGEIIEEASVEDISTEYDYVENLFLLLVEGKAMPISLNEIVYDYLCAECVE